MELSLFLHGEGFCEDCVRKRCKSYVRQNEKRALMHPRYVGDSEPLRAGQFGVCHNAAMSHAMKMLRIFGGSST